MTEAEWLAATDPQPMLSLLRERVSDRKLRLFACSCCRRFWHLLTDDRSRHAVEEAERYADGLGREEDVGLAGANALDAVFEAVRRKIAALTAANCRAVIAARAAFSTTHPVFELEGPATAVAACRSISSDPESALGSREVVLAQLSAALRDVVGNPFRPVAAHPSWLTSTVVALAEGIYADRAFDRMPILADALQDAGCESDEVLSHCRGDGPHEPGCFVIDLVLGKK